MRLFWNVVGLAALSASLGIAADVSAGQAVYERSCKGCHGADGTSNPAIGKAMQVQMRDLKSAEVQALSDDDIKKTITDGKGKMRPVKTVAAGSLNDVVAYVRTLKK